MINDGVVPELAVGDRWDVELMLSNRRLQPGDLHHSLELAPDRPVDAGPAPLPWYRFNARLLRRRPQGAGVHGHAIEVNGLFLGLSNTPRVPDAHIVSGWGVPTADRWNNQVWAFPETRRNCTVRAITLHSAPRIGARDTAVRFDWSRAIRRLVSSTKSRWEFNSMEADVFFVVDVTF
jgi:hypothetical protein